MADLAAIQGQLQKVRPWLRIVATVQLRAPGKNVVPRLGDDPGSTPAVLSNSASDLRVCRSPARLSAGADPPSCTALLRVLRVMLSCVQCLLAGLLRALLRNTSQERADLGLPVAAVSTQRPDGG